MLWTKLGSSSANLKSQESQFIQTKQIKTRRTSVDHISYAQGTQRLSSEWINWRTKLISERRRMLIWLSEGYLMEEDYLLVCIEKKPRWQAVRWIFLERKMLAAKDESKNFRILEYYLLDACCYSCESENCRKKHTVSVNPSDLYRPPPINFPFVAGLWTKTLSMIRNVAHVKTCLFNELKSRWSEINLVLIIQGWIRYGHSLSSGTIFDTNVGNHKLPFQSVFSSSFQCNKVFYSCPIVQIVDLGSTQRYGH